MLGTRNVPQDNTRVSGQLSNTLKSYNSIDAAIDIWHFLPKLSSMHSKYPLLILSTSFMELNILAIRISIQNCTMLVLTNILE